jgi:shikimate dehydrogenase
VTPATTAATRLLAVLGHPVGHSRSPALHSAAIAAAGLDAVYLAFDVPPADLPTAVAGLRALPALGANVTLPHKVAVLDLVDRLTDEARLTGAANTLFWDGDPRGGGALVADNTDAPALQRVLVEDCGVGAGDLALVYGAGGAARAAAVALGRLGAVVAVEARRPDAAAEVAALAHAAGGAAPRAGTAPAEPVVVVNATPLGRRGEPLPPHLMRLGAGQVALDLGYGPPTPFLQAAAAAGARAVDGTGMLVVQAELAFARWFGAPPPPGVMAAAA